MKEGLFGNEPNESKSNLVILCYWFIVQAFLMLKSYPLRSKKRLKILCTGVLWQLYSHGSTIVGFRSQITLDLPSGP